jgi:DNA mismatch repair protein MutL
MHHSIQILPIEIANQIAAGEVIERPASVVKELLENSIDAAATQIDLDVEQDGTNLIRVRDNGTGISKNDLLLAITPHATSKIKQLDDLNQLTSLGFRGEALASISSISEFSLTSRVQHSDEAWQIELNATQRKTQVKPAAHPVGTTIEVRNLFFNTPVRRKFLKAERTEFQHIEEVVRQIVLSAPQLALTLRHHNRIIMQVRAAHDEAEQSVRVGKILGRDFLRQAIYLDVARGDLQLRGWILPEEASRAHSDQQYFFLNGRILRDKLILHAIRTACDTIFAAGRYPAYVLFFNCDLDKVDVNVHPTKHEVRFVQPRLIHDFIEHTLHRVLHEKTHREMPMKTLSNEELFVSEPTFIKEAANQYHYASGEPLLGKLLGGVIKEKFLLLEGKEHLVLINYLASQLFLSRLQMENSLQQGGLKAQPRLFPETIKLTAAEVAIAIERENAWHRYGIVLQNVAPDAVMIRGLPHWLRVCDYKSLVHDLLTAPIDNTLDVLTRYATIDLAQTTTQLEDFVTQLSFHSRELLLEKKLIHLITYEQLGKLFS